MKLRLIRILLLFALCVNMQSLLACCNNSTSSSACVDTCDANACNADCLLGPQTDVRTIFIPRSVGANTARELVAWQSATHNHEYATIGNCCDESHAAVALTFEYTRSFRNECIANSLFGGTTLKFAGSNIADRTSDELIADYFGLSQNFRGSLNFNPRITNYVAEIDVFWDMSGWLCDGFWLRLHAPIVNTKWDLQVCQKDNENVDPFCSLYIGAPLFCSSGTECYMGPGNGPASTILQALSGSYEFGAIEAPICAGKFSACSHAKTALADIDIIFGFDIRRTECSHFGIFAMGVAPTGNRPRSEYIFSPIVGNGHHWELGGGVMGHVLFWEYDSSDFGLYFEGNITHMFNDKQCRLFDMCPNGAFSRYMLLTQFESNGVTPTGRFISASCFANREVEVSRAIKGDVSFKFAVRGCNWVLDLGWNIYGHSAEKISLKNQCCTDPVGRYAIKATSDLRGLPYTFDVNTGDVTIPLAVPDSLPVARSLSCANMFVVPNACSVDNNGGIPCPASDTTEEQFIDSINFSGSPLYMACGTPLTSQSTLSLIYEDPIAVPVGESVNPVLLADCNLNLRSGASPASFTNKFFGHINYDWDACGVNPYIGVGGEVEFSKCPCRTSCTNGCTPCTTGVQSGATQNCGITSSGACESRCNTVTAKGVRANLNQWGVWFKTGIIF